MNSPSIGADHCPADGETEAGTPGVAAAGFVEPHEALEYSLAVAFGDAVPTVTDRDLGLPIVSSGLDPRVRPRFAAARSERETTALR